MNVFWFILGYLMIGAMFCGIFHNLLSEESKQGKNGYPMMVMLWPIIVVFVIALIPFWIGTMIGKMLDGKLP